MRHDAKRMHPLKIIVSYIHTLKEAIFIFILLFVVNFSSDAMWVKIGRILFFTFLIYRFFAVILEWWRTRYVITDETIELYQGAFVRKHRSIPFEKVQNVQLTTPFYLRLFKLTSLTLETGAKSNDASVTFEALRKEEADQIEQILDQFRNNSNKEKLETEQELCSHEPEATKSSSEYTIHFNPTRKDILKASVLSFSYLVLIPILFTAFSNIDEIYDLSSQAKKTFDFISNSWILITVGIAVLITIAILFGLVHTYLKYGKYEISSDDERIYIKSGVLNEQHFSIRKKNVQAVQIEQSPIKRILKLAEVKLISTGGVKEASKEVNSLYPFLSVNRAYSIVGELLPGFEVQTDMERLPKKSLLARLCRIPFLWIIATILLIIFIPKAWFLSPILLLFSFVSRTMDYYFTRFLIHDSFIQFKTGGFSTTLFMTTREKVIEFELTQSLLKRRFGLATISATNRSKPVKVQALQDIPINMAKDAFRWYTGRNPEMNQGSLPEK